MPLNGPRDIHPSPRHAWDTFVGMDSRLAKSIPLAVASVSALWWSICLTLVQTSTEPAKPWTDAWVGNNSYWNRDVRFAMITFAVLAFIWAVRGDLRLTGCAVLAGLLWVAADVLLDRVDLNGVLAAVATSLASLGAVAGVWFGVVRRAYPLAARRGVLIVSAAVAACLGALMAQIESPSDAEAILPWCALLAGFLGTAVTLGCLSAFGSRYTRTVSTVVVGALAALVVIVIRLMPMAVDDDLNAKALYLAIALVCLLLSTTAVRAWDATGAGRWAVAVVGCVLAFIPMLFCLLYVGFATGFIGRWLTSLAANPPVSGADTDLLISMLAILAGLGMGALIAGVAAARGQVEIELRVLRREAE